MTRPAWGDPEARARSGRSARLRREGSSAAAHARIRRRKVEPHDYCYLTGGAREFALNKDKDGRSIPWAFKLLPLEPAWPEVTQIPTRPASLRLRLSSSRFARIWTRAVFEPRNNGAGAPSTFNPVRRLRRKDASISRPIVRDEEPVVARSSPQTSITPSRNR